MQSEIGFILLTHSNHGQMLRLISRLNALFNLPAIVCHHDFSKCPLPLEQFSSNVSFVRPHVATKWGDFSLVEAVLRSIRDFMQRPEKPAWMVLLSGADYPIKPAATILSDLNTGGYDAFVEHRPVEFGQLDRPFQKICFDRYCVKRVWVPWINSSLRPTKRAIEIRRPWLTRWLLPFSDALKCHGGSQWFCANRKAMDHILKTHENLPALERHYRTVKCSDESYLQTLLANSSLKLNGDNRRFIDWSSGNFHPKVLGMADLPKLQATPMHFARKFAENDPVLDAIDAYVDAIGKASAVH